MTIDPFDLERFVEAQRPCYQAVLAELRAGEKRSHWMWFIFPQMRGLGHSPASRFFGIRSLEEARAYLAHPILGPRLEETARAVLATEGRTLRQIFGTPDDAKFHSSMTLFALASPDGDNPYRQALARWHGGEMDPATLALPAIKSATDERP
jgi:uncharacterized protein (DUF1810 family)